MNKRDDYIPVLLKRCNRLIDNHIDTVLKEHSIARSQYRVLYYIAREREVAQKALVRIMEVQASTLTLMIEPLVLKGLLVRSKDTSDKRANLLHLSPKGKKLFESIPDPAIGIERVIIKNLTNDESTNLRPLLKKVIESLT